jgi:hypothetical protein
MTTSKRITWYERQKLRKSSPFFRLLERSFGFRVLFASAIAFLLLAGVNRFENCYARKYSSNCLSTNFWKIISISNVESFSIVTAALVYLLESGKRKQQEHQEALELIMEAKEMGIVLGLARIKALETLSQDGLWQDGWDLGGINLEQLDVPHSRWRGANFSRTVLLRANFSQTDLTGANFTDADLTGANLGFADLTDADLTGANLTDANLAGANLTRTKLDLKPRM